MNNQMPNYMPGNAMPGNAMPEHDHLSDKALGMAYVPWQQNFGTVYDLDKGFCKGTIFPCLDKPFLGRSGCK